MSKKIAVLHDNPVLPGKKFSLISLVSPESRQKNDVYAFKLHDVCGTREEAEALAEYYRELDKDFDVLIGSVGCWSPWIWDMNEIPDAKFADDRLTDLVKAHRGKQTSDTKFRKQVDKHVDELKKASTKEGQEALANRKEPAVSLYYKIKQLEAIRKKRTRELEALNDKFHTEYTRKERNEAKKADLPISEPAAMDYTLLSTADIDKAEGNEKKEENF